jgi:nitrite reductase/ring-hydroxylating ferredoxin subunit
MNDRRHFLRVIGGATAALTLPGCGGGTSSTSSTSGSAGSGGGGGAGGAGGSTAAGCTSMPAGVSLGPPSTYSSTGLSIVPNSTVLVGRDAGGLYALSSVCTHQGCNMDDSFGTPLGSIFPGGIVCNCHGSRFDDLGNVINGPAFSPLVAFALALGCDGNLYVDTSQIVPSSQRVIV